jgi:twitching motility protein PilT
MLPVFEIMHCTSAIRNLIREGRTHQMSAVINTSAAEGMVGMDAGLLALYKDGKISTQELLTHALAPETVAKQASL